MKNQLLVKLIKIIGIISLIFFILTMIRFMFSLKSLDIIPEKIMLVLVFIFVIFAMILACMHLKKISSIIATLLSIGVGFCCLFGSSFIGETTETIQKVTTVEYYSSIVNVYVLSEDTAQQLEDIKTYTIGINRELDRENVDQAICQIEDQLGVSLSIKEYDTTFELIDALKNNEIQCMIINESHLGIALEMDAYKWITEGLRTITSIEIKVAKEESPEGENTSSKEVITKSEDVVVFYLSGIDTFGGIQARSRSDVNILAVANLKTKEMLLLSTPRDSYVELSVSQGKKDKLTHAGIYGVDVSIDALERLYDVDVDYYFRVNFDGFIDIIDALGGIEVYSDLAFAPIAKPEIPIKEGMNQLNGEGALAFARERYAYADGDYHRAKNQMDVIKAVIKKVASSALLTNYKEVMSAVSGSIDSNIPEEEISRIVKMQLEDMSAWKVESHTTKGKGIMAETFSMPGCELSCQELDQAVIDESRAKIKKICEGK